MIKFVCFLLTTIGYAQDLKCEEHLYIFTRSTSLKQTFIAKDFNISDSLSTHVGIGFKNGNDYSIYNVSNEKVVSGSALIQDSSVTFSNIPDIRQFTIWELKVSKDQIKRVKAVILKYQKLKVRFDHNFLLGENEELYCSEFVSSVLNNSLENERTIQPTSKTLSAFYSNALGREKLLYYPVDFFMELKDLILIHQVNY